MKLQNKVFVVTGASGGIGGEIVLELLRKGAHVAAVDLHKDGMLAIQKRAGVSADKLSLHKLSITDKSAVEKLPAQVLEAHGVVDGLINCAGIVQPFVRINDIDYDAVERVMQVNFYGMLYMTKSFLPLLLKRTESYIANVSSMGGFLPVPGQAVYGASKAAVKLFTEGLFAETLNAPVHVSIVFPGATNTNITQNSGVSLPSAMGADAQKMAAQMLPADKAAQIIVRGIERNKPQIFTGKDSKFLNILYRLAPVYATKFIAKKMRSLLG